MNVSIVSGTYNRLPLLQKMVASARAALGPWLNLSHEFVLVDGGSQDGTQAWCRGQPDVRLIEHGKLLGAVKAFNDGAFAALGDYVVLANDDIEFLGDSLYLAWVYMQDHPDCGIGCFYQDRGGKGWHVETMPVIKDGRQAWDVYGQVCMVPKWLGDHVGWWGDYLTTYGGDNELSARVYETGFKVSPVPGAQIHDAEPDDALRKINNISGAHDPRAIHGHNPDSWAWGRHWRGRPEHLQFTNGVNLVGPVVSYQPIYSNPLGRSQRILYLPIFEPGWAIQKQQKRGLREALARVAVVHELDYMLPAYAGTGHEALLNELKSLLARFNPTMVLTQIHNPGQLTLADLQQLRGLVPGVAWVNWNGDYWPDNLTSPEGLALARVFDLQTTVNRAALDIYRQQDIRAEYWQIGWEPDGVGHEPQGEDERHDVVFLANGYSKERQAFVKTLRSMPGIRFGLYGQGWPKDWAKGQCLYDFVTACRLYRGAKLSLGDSQWPDTGFVSNRVMQALAAGGAALAHQWFRDMDLLGLEDGRTCIIWRTPGELQDKIRYYLDHEDERRRIAVAGQQLALSAHSFDARVKELFEWFGIGQSEECWRW